MDASENYNQIMNFLAASETADAEQVDSDLTRESLFQSLAKKKYSSSSSDKTQDPLLGELEGLASLQDKVSRLQSAKADCERLAAFAPADIQEQVSTLLASSSPYLDY